jgi:hypothetical protein
MQELRWGNIEGHGDDFTDNGVMRCAKNWAEVQTGWLIVEAVVLRVSSHARTPIIPIRLAFPGKKHLNSCKGFYKSKAFLSFLSSNVNGYQINLEPRSFVEIFSKNLNEIPKELV